MIYVFKEMRVVIVVTEHDVMERWQSIQNDEERILFIVGAAGSGKSAIMRELSAKEGWQYIEAKDLLSEGILEIPREERPEAAKRLLLDAIEKVNADVVIIDSVQAFFAPILNLHPIKMLKEISQTYPLVIGWRGSFDGKTLLLEHNNDKEYFAYEVTHTNHVISVD